jgi:hypothetical protein
MLNKRTQLIKFLKGELSIPESAITTALRQQEDADPNQLPMILWQYGLVSMKQLEQIFDWLDRFGSDVTGPSQA